MQHDNSEMTDLINIKINELYKDLEEQSFEISANLCKTSKEISLLNLDIKDIDNRITYIENIMKRIYSPSEQVIDSISESVSDSASDISSDSEYIKTDIETPIEKSDPIPTHILNLILDPIIDPIFIYNNV